MIFFLHFLDCLQNGFFMYEDFSDNLYSIHVYFKLLIDDFMVLNKQTQKILKKILSSFFLTFYSVEKTEKNRKWKKAFDGPNIFCNFNSDSRCPPLRRLL